MIRDLLIENSYNVSLNMAGKIPEENGIIDEKILNERKDKIFKFVSDYLKKDFLNVEKSFPKNGEVEVNLSLDFVVIRKDRFNELVKILEAYE